MSELQSEETELTMVRVFRESTVRAAVSGVVAVAGGLAVGELVAVSVSQFASPPYRAVAAFLVDHAPAFAREFAIDRFGTADKPVLLAGMALVILLIAVTAGVLQVKRPPVGVLIVVAFAAVGVAAALTRPTVEVSYVVPPVAAGLVAVGVLVVLGGAGVPSGTCPKRMRPAQGGGLAASSSVRSGSSS